MKIIGTYNSNFKDFIINQIKNFNAKIEYDINETISIISTKDSFEKFSNRLIDSKILFFHHIQPVNFEINLDEDYLKSIENIIFSNIDNFFDKNKFYSIQIRTFNCNYNKLDIINTLEKSINYKKDNKNPQQIISILINNNICYIGFSKVELNLSKWNGGEVRYNYNNCISRAEFKLMELFDFYNINFDNFKNALDLGCSPGGWSKVLLNKGLKVFGIDPAEVDVSIKNNRNFKHFKMLSENFKKINKDNYDIIVNDMKMGYKNSIKTTKMFLKNLNKNGIIIMTIKLFKNDNIIDAVNTVKNNFNNIVMIKQLYHNRNEFTIVVK